MIIKELQVLPSSPSIVIPTVFAGKASLQGTVRLVLKQPLHLKSLVVKFKGRADITDWEKQFVSHKLCALILPNIAPDNVTLAAGTHDFSFDFDLDKILQQKDVHGSKKLDSLPPSIATSYGSIQYRLVAILTPSKALKLESISSNTMSNLRSSLTGKAGVLRGGQYRVSHPIVIYRPIVPSMDLLRLYQSRRAPSGYSGVTGDGQLKYCIRLSPIFAMDEDIVVHLRLEGPAQVKKVIFDIVQAEKHKQLRTDDIIRKSSIDRNHVLGVAPAAIKLAPNASTKNIAPSIRSHPFQTAGHVLDETQSPLDIFEFCAVLKPRERDGDKKQPANLKPSMRSALIQVKHSLRMAIQYVAVAEHREGGDDDFQVHADNEPLIATTTTESKTKQVLVQTKLRFTPILEGTSSHKSRCRDSAACLTVVDEDDEFSDNPFMQAIEEHGASPPPAEAGLSKAKRTAADKGLDITVGGSSGSSSSFSPTLLASGPNVTIIPATPMSAASVTIY